MPPEYCSR